ncbi:hypothetical protein AYI70_g6704, partial [Smittium culicis]
MYLDQSRIKGSNYQRPHSNHTSTNLTNCWFHAHSGTTCPAESPTSRSRLDPRTHPVLLRGVYSEDQDYR